MKFHITIIFLILVIFSTLLSAGTEENDKDLKDRTIYIEQRIKYLLNQCQGLLEKANWQTANDGKEVKGFRLEERYDEITVKITGESDADSYTFTVAINKNGIHTIDRLKFSETALDDDNHIRGVVLSVLSPQAVLREGIGQFRKSYSSILSFGYSRTSDGGDFYPKYTSGKLHLSWQLKYDPSAKVILPETPLAIGDYLFFSVYSDLSKIIHENSFNIDLLVLGKNKYRGSVEHGTRVMYGFFNGFEYFRPGFSDTTMKWDRPVYNNRPNIQYTIWRALQGGVTVSRRDGSALYSAELMMGAGMGINSSLSIAGISEEEGANLPDVFPSTRYRKQNYYYSYTLPARLSLSADRVHGFRFEAGYNYYFFYPVFVENMYDMLHVAKGSIGYYLSFDVLLNAQYEFWLVESMFHDKTTRHHWNHLILEFRNFF